MAFKMLPLLLLLLEPAAASDGQKSNFVVMLADVRQCTHIPTAALAAPPAAAA
jgi:hypothetical protein